jgi:ATP-dependent RNA helicase DeaD
VGRPRIAKGTYKTLILSRLFGRKSEPEAATTDSGARGGGSVAVAERPNRAAPTTERTPPDYNRNHRGDDTESAAPRRRSRGGRRRNRSGDSTAGESTPTRQPDRKGPATFDGALPEAFKELGLGNVALQAVAVLGFTQPTPIQERALPVLLAGRDVVGIAQTGTGKTIAFGLPLAQTIDPTDNRVQALVMVPTRELATQVLEVMDHLGRYYNFTSMGLVGGKRIAGDLTRLEKGAHVVVGTPGRVIDHIKRGTLNLRAAKFVVLDEADQMLDIGFLPDINYILRCVPKQRQTALFSATMPMSIKKLVYRYMDRPEEILVDPEQRTAEGVDQQYCEVSERDKIQALKYLFEERGLGRSLIFRKTKIGVDRLTDQLRGAGVGAQAIHGDLRQSERDRVMKDFREGRLEFLVATNVAARGLDIPDIQHVINYDVPQNSEEYIHRIGRTARAGKRGYSITFVGEWDLDAWEKIIDDLGEERPEYLELPTRWD